MKKIKISDNIKGFLNFDLRNLLKLVENGNHLFWTMKDMDINILNSDESNVDLNDEQYNLLELMMNKNEYNLTWEKLLQIANLNIQVINGKIIGYSDVEKIIFTAFDSSYWEVETNIPFIINKIRKQFRDIS